VDWLVEAAPFRAAVREDPGGRRLTLDNGIVARTFVLAPNAACIALDDLASDRGLLRAVRPEASVTLDGREYPVGGLTGQPNHAYLTEQWLAAMTADPSAFRYVGHEVGVPAERLAWKRVRHCAPDAVWPPRGVAVRFDYVAPAAAAASHRDVKVSVHYELYDGIPAMSKWVEVHNGGDADVELDRCTVETLAVVEHANWVEHRDGVAQPVPESLHVETDFAFGGFNHPNANRHVVHWRSDPEYSSQVNYARQTPCLLVVEATRGPDVILAPSKSFATYRAFELVHDSTERERRGLALRRFYRTLAPWVTENPLILHVVSTDPEVVRRAVDQAAECGFEMVSLSFGSGLDMEDGSDANLQKFAGLVAYAEAKGIQLGGYSLLSSRRIQPDSDNCVHPDTGRPGGQTHGFCPALAYAWGQAYFGKLRTFFETTGMLQFTHDGSYPGDVDAAARPPLQRGADDSQWVQWRIITDFYQDLRARGVYLRVPDYYYLAGSNECGMGYREVNWSLPRAQQVIHTRQNIFDGTWTKTPSMGWMFVPLTQYHGGGAAATIEPLDEHIDHYRRMLQSNLGYGVQAVYRGHRLYDTPRVRDMVREQVQWYLDHRAILESDVVHGRRADGRDLDWALHVHPDLEDRGMLVVFNPLEREVRRTIAVDVYYTGLRGVVRGHPEGGAAIELPVDDRNLVRWDVTVPPGGMRWMLLR